VGYSPYLSSGDFTSEPNSSDTESDQPDFRNIDVWCWHRCSVLDKTTGFGRSSYGCHSGPSLRQIRHARRIGRSIGNFRSVDAPSKQEPRTGNALRVDWGANRRYSDPFRHPRVACVGKETPTGSRCGTRSIRARNRFCDQSLGWKLRLDRPFSFQFHWRSLSGSDTSHSHARGVHSGSCKRNLYDP
jgi:hypothetical protein